MSGIENWTGGETSPEIATEAAPEAQHVSWYLDENTEGIGDRPDWLEAKYNKVSDQAKAYKEVERKLGQTQGSAPEAYDFDAYKDAFGEDNAHINDFKNSAKELKLSQEAFDKMLDPMAKYYESLQPDMDEEIKKLGEHANAKIKTVNTWAGNNLSEKSMETLGKISNTAEVVMLMDEMRQLHYQTQSRVPTNMQSATKVAVESAEDIQNEIVNTYDRYLADPAYRAEMSGRLKQAFGED